MKKQGLIAGFALAAAIALSPYGISAASETGPAVGDNAPDGTVYAGVLPDTHKPLYTTPADAPGVYTWSKGVAYCRALQASGHQDWHVPSMDDELNILYENRNTGALKGTFNETGSDPAGWYWATTSNDGFATWAKRFSDGNQDGSGRRSNVSSLRCVR